MSRRTSQSEEWDGLGLAVTAIPPPASPRRAVHDRNPTDEEIGSEPLWLLVEDDAHGVSLQDLLQQRWPEVDRVYLRNLLLDGEVRVNGVAR